MPLEKINTIATKEIDLIVYDFDGVMTDNRVILLQDGTEGVVVNRADGLGVDLIRNLGISQLILSTETNPVVKVRAEKLAIEAIGSCGDKKGALVNYCLRNGFDLSKVLYVGNDINDMEVMKIVGFPIAPADSHQDIREIARLTTKARGGEGIVRELADLISKGIIL